MEKILHLFHFNGNNLTHCKQSMSEKYAVISHGLHVSFLSFLSLFLSFGVFSLIFLDLFRLIMHSCMSIFIHSIFLWPLFSLHIIQNPNKIIINETFVKRWINCDKYNDYYVELCDQCALDSTTSLQFHE